jgi:hypothetical protein
MPMHFIGHVRNPARTFEISDNEAYFEAPISVINSSLCIEGFKSEKEVIFE